MSPPSMVTWLDRARAVSKLALRTRSLDIGPLAREFGRSALGARGPWSGALMRAYATTSPHAIALKGPHGAISRAELEERVERLTTGLRTHLALREGDRALVVMANRPEAVEVRIALARLGASPLARGRRSTPSELVSAALGHAVRAVILDADVASDLGPDGIVQLRSGLRHIVPFRRYLCVGEGSFGASYEAVLASSTPDRRGRPAAPGPSPWETLAVLSDLPIVGDDRHLVASPMHRPETFRYVRFTLALGGTVVVEPTLDPDAFLAAVQEHRITTATLSATLLRGWLDLPAETRASHDTRSLRAIFSGGPAFPVSLARAATQELGHVLG